MDRERMASQRERSRSAEEPATVPRRVAAYLIDSGIVFVTWFMALLIPVIPYAAFPSLRDVSVTIGSIIALLLPVYWFVYHWRFNAKGKSPGKRVMSLAIEKDSGVYLIPQLGPPGPAAGFVRTAGQVIGLIPFGLGYWWALWDGHTQAWHDKMAGTRVVRSRGEYRAPMPGPDVGWEGSVPEAAVPGDGQEPVPPLPAAPFLRRAAAYVIDAGILVGVMAALFVIPAILGGIFDPGGRLFIYVAATLLLMAPVYWFGYFWWSNSSGRSVGKRAMRLAAVKRTSGATGVTLPGRGRGFKRTWGQVLSILPLGLGFWWAGWDTNGQAWHDKIARTIVVSVPKPAIATASMPKVRFKFQAPDVGRSLGGTVLWLLGIYAVIAVTTGSLLSWAQIWPYLLALIVTVVLLLLSRRFGVLRGDVRIDDRGMGWSDGQSAKLIRYEDVRAIHVDLEKAVTVTFKRKHWFRDPSEETLTFVLDDPEGFVRELQARVESVRGEQLPVVH